MSEPVTNADVEDVLSSIRRLVSEDKRPKPSAKPVSENDRLVLTPALRVASPLPDAQVDDDGEDDIQVQPDALVHRPSQTSQRYDDSSYIEREEPTAERTEAPNDRRNPAEDYASDPYDFEDDSADDVDAPDLRAADNEAVNQEAHDDAPDMARSMAIEDEDDEDDHVDTLRLDDPVDVQDDGVPADDDVALPNDAAAAENPAKPAKLEMLRPSGRLSDKFAALETAIGKISDRWEPDSVGADDYSGTEAPAMAWEDDIERDATGARMMDSDEAEVPNAAQAQPAADDAAEADTSNPGINADDQFLDEDALRDLVSEIVRAELQGALGERITRNVRKLVRREIHRALTAQELE
tara:strand:+ start:75696 stop:76754 length:1059 start_codon:yes stop_codon:yes gene_type:complete